MSQIKSFSKSKDHFLKFIEFCVLVIWQYSMENINKIDKSRITSGLNYQNSFNISVFSPTCAGFTKMPLIFNASRHKTFKEFRDTYFVLFTDSFE